jgi:hypothetical protein
MNLRYEGVTRNVRAASSRLSPICTLRTARVQSPSREIQFADIVLLHDENHG